VVGACLNKKEESSDNGGRGKKMTLQKSRPATAVYEINSEKRQTEPGSSRGHFCRKKKKKTPLKKPSNQNTPILKPYTRWTNRLDQSITSKGTMERKRQSRVNSDPKSQKSGLRETKKGVCQTPAIKVGTGAKEEETGV